MFSLMIAMERTFAPGEVIYWEPIRYSKEECLAALLAADAYGEAMKAAAA